MTDTVDLNDSEDLAEWLTECINDSMDMDWTGKTGALAIIDAMQRDGVSFSRSPIDRLSDAMRDEGIHQIRRWPTGIFTVELMDERKGQGNTPRAAIDNAKEKAS